MSNPDGTFIYIGTYPDETAARVDYDVVKALHAVDAVGSFDAAVVTKDDKGKIHVNKDETATRAGGWIGVGVGALVGILFPPAILASAAVGGVIGGVTGHLWKGMSRADVKELGDTIDAGEAALVVIGELTVSEALQKAELHALKETKKEVDASFKELERAIKAQ
ncbi:MAG TPA: DUF1269 domain-containing protein [Actinomycetes bacterium]|nr:DUF1269 domain-containing protein [Actinomycetes bacterium]